MTMIYAALFLYQAACLTVLIGGTVVVVRVLRRVWR